MRPYRPQFGRCDLSSNETRKPVEKGGGGDKNPAMCLGFNNSNVNISSSGLFLSSLLIFVFLVLFFSSRVRRDKAPGQRECDSSIDNINKCIRDIEQASLAAVSQNLPSRDDISLEVSGHRKMAQNLCRHKLCLCFHLSFCYLRRY